MNPSKFSVSLALLAFVFLLPLAAAMPASAKPASSSQADAMQLIDGALAAGRLRASSQRVARLYLESGSGQRPHRTQSMLRKELADVDASLAALKKVAITGDKEKRDLARALGSLTGQWADLRPIVTADYRGDRTQVVYDISEQMYIYSAKITFLFEDAANSEAGYMIDIAGRLQANSERIAKAAIHGIMTRNASSAVDFITWKKEYVDGYRELLASPLNDDYQKRNHDLGKMMWVLFDDVITRSAAKAEVSQILDISKCADGMWNLAESSRAIYITTYKEQSGKDKLIARNSGGKAS